jgi:hypothetical protein
MEEEHSTELRRPATDAGGPNEAKPTTPDRQPAGTKPLPRNDLPPMYDDRGGTVDEAYR